MLFCHPLLCEHVVQNQRVCYYLLPWFETGFDFLQTRILGQHISTDDFDAAKSVVVGGNENKISVVHSQHGRTWDNGVHLYLLAAERSAHKHTQPHHPGILDFDPNLSSANTGIENGANVADLSLKRLVGIG